ncbi:DUF6252 family protein [Hymenobacter sp. 5317J-9]|uniref:DUF6252 family protein n=1 Tax=Hymenobacter sp. 5317J-9 TaxID=2932250 RepID=UPI001FD6C5EE|nr:DUF6252 family protein [Hymenobacter sp. 5317J-9]UOQ98671.1 DUF6252 family protein [Hymenobacter sp. 5317J-9]
MHFPIPKLLLLLALLSSLGGCKKDPAPEPPTDPLSLLPPETQTGRRTFGCLVNGQAWTPAGSPLGGPVLTAQYLNKHLSVVASGLTSDGKSSGGVIQIGIDNITTVGRYTLIRRDTSFVSYDDVRTNCLYYPNASHPATVEITKLDLPNRIVSGRFSFTLETPGCGRVEVTNGRFDCPF